MWQFKTITSSIFKRRTVFVDNFIFRCYYRGSFWILVIGSMLVSLKQYFGEHIHCLAHKDLKNVINTFCFFSTTFTVTKHLNSKEVAHPGVGPVEEEDDVVHHAYYQWVPFFLFTQALFFYLPHLIWKLKERKRMAKWAESPVPKEEVAIRLLVYRDWSYWLVICELLNAFNLVLQVYLTNVFLQGKFLDLGYSYDDLEFIFPKVTKCTWRQYGPSGTIQKHDALCVVALNVINEKIFLVLWYWYILLAILSCFSLVWRIITLIFYKRPCFSILMFSSVSSGAHLKTSQAMKVAYYTNFSEWLFVYYLGKNMKQQDFLNVISGLGPLTKEKIQNYPALDPSKSEEAYFLDGPTSSPTAPEESSLKESNC